MLLKGAEVPFSGCVVLSPPTAAAQRSSLNLLSQIWIANATKNSQFFLVFLLQG